MKTGEQTIYIINRAKIKTKKNTDTEDWLRMLMCELIKLSGDLSLTPTKILTSLGTAKMRTIGLRIKKQILESGIHRNRRA